MSEGSRSNTLVEVCEQLAELTCQAASMVRETVDADGSLPSSFGDFFADLANLQHDIADVVFAYDQQD